MNENRFNFDLLKIAEIASFVLAIVFYFLSGKVKSASLVLFLFAIIFLVLGIGLVVAKLFKTFKVTYDLYNASIKQKRMELYNVYGILSKQADKELKVYKKTYLKTYRRTNFKYGILMLTLVLIMAYILYLAVAVIISL